MIHFYNEENEDIRVKLVIRNISPRYLDTDSATGKFSIVLLGKNTNKMTALDLLPELQSSATQITFHVQIALLCSVQFSVLHLSAAVLIHARTIIRAQPEHAGVLN